MGDSRPTHKHADDDGHFRRKDSVFRDWISTEPGARFPPEPNRYAIYANLGCPWAHRTILVRGLKSLDPFIQLILTDFDLTENGWLFTGRNGSEPKDPLYGFTGLKQLYLKANPEYEGRYTVPVLWDKKTETIVNNESSEIIRMLYDSFDEFLEPDLREVNRPGGGFYPTHLRKDIDSMNDWVYNTVNNGVYKCGFATSQEAYDTNVYPLFKSLDRLEAHLADPAHQPFLFGEHITEADIRLYTTMARFDVAYHSIFQCNLKMIRHDYPRLSKWLRNLYWDESERTNGGVFKKTTFFEIYKYGYLRAKVRQLHGGLDRGIPLVIPRGPLPDIEPLTDEEEGELINGTAKKLESTTASSPSSHNPFSAQGEKSGTGAIFGTDVDSPATNKGDEDDGGTGVDEEGEFHPRRVVQHRTAHGDENAKWYKAAKKAEKQEGAPSLHLAL
ncbi:glutathione S-transferase [Capronia coronata CBS 617.96]|uniref:Glutathione S-transferase n=1 Tax=Capronia coronata CBS 617.96 TaxID=1182541 RepID=W9YG90_9EURO|nr:glutathione S-transferase [Capronia coronata CBS 617.96]EXJ88695.1 glutathione S-transferase [Capronia coronata CBS 617.96]